MKNSNLKHIDLDMESIKDIIEGDGHTIILFNDGTVAGYGSNHTGQLGLGDIDKTTVVQMIPIKHVKTVRCGDYYTIFIKNDGTVWGCGENTYGQLGLGDDWNKYNPVKLNVFNVKDIYCNANQTQFLLNNGMVLICGLVCLHTSLLNESCKSHITIKRILTPIHIDNKYSFFK